jgi:hypothetical protein
MVRSTAISWKIGPAAAAVLALPFWPWPALADDKPAEKAEKAETRPQPLQPKAVRVILLPPASDTAFAAQRPEQMEAAPVILVRPSGTADNTAADTAAIAMDPADSAAIGEPGPDLMESARFMVQPAGKAATAQPRPEPAKAQKEDALADTPSVLERNPRVASLPPAGSKTAVSPRPGPAKAQKDQAVGAIPALPGRSPFRQAPFKSEIEVVAVAEPAPPKGNAALRFLNNLWPGNKQASAPAASPPPPPAPATAPETDQTAAKPKPNFLEKLQFWKN